MINVRYIENILGKGKRKTKQFAYLRDKTVKEYIEQAGFPIEDHRVILSGRKVKDLTKKPNNNAEIIVTPEVEGIFYGVAVAIWEAGTLMAGIALALDIAMFAYAVISTILAAQRKPSFGMGGEGIDEGSSTYGWDGIRTTQDVGIPVPVVYGEHRVGGNIINAWIRSDGRKNYLNVLLALCEGEIEDISSLQIDGNPSANFDGITLTKRYGTNDQSVIPNFEDAHNLYSVNVDLNTEDGSHTYTTQDSDVEGFEIYLQFPAGLFQSDNGIKEWSVTYKVEYKVTGSVDPWTEADTVTVTDKTRSRLREVFRQTGLTAEQYDIKITRTSAASSLDPIKEGDLTWLQTDEIKTDDYKYPNTALLGIEALATEQLSGAMPNFTVLLKGKKISAPQVMNGAAQVDWEDYYWDDDNSEFKLLSDDTSLTWDGSTYVEQYCANPIWCLKDLLIADRYGLGEFIETGNISDADFLEMAKYCEEKVPDSEGDYEKRFRLDVVIDSSTRALDLLLQLSMNFRGLVSFSAGSIRALIDKPEDPVQLFNMGSIVEDSFKQTWKSRKQVPNVIEVQYLDKDQDYKQDTLAYIDEAALAAGDPMRKKSIRLFATGKSQVLREARYALKYAKNLKRSISFKVGIEAIACQAGDVISVQHDVPQWGYGGRVVSATSSTVTLDQDVTIEDGKSYSIMVMLSDDTIVEKTVTNSPETTSTISIDGTWTTNPSAYDKYTFGETNSIKKDFRVLGLDRDSTNIVKVSAIEYNSDVYDDSAVDLPTNNYSSLDLSVPAVEDMVLTERLVKLNDGTIENAIDVWWDIPDRDNYVRTVERCRIYISQTNSSNKEDYRAVGEATGKSFQILGDIIDDETYYVKVVSISADGKESKFADSPVSDITIVGKSAVPSDVSSFLVNQDRDRMKFGWTEVSDVDVWGYEIRQGADWASGNKLAFVQGDSYITTDFRTGTSQSYWIKALDTSGNYSDNATEAVITVAEIPFRNIIQEYSEKPSWSGDIINLTITESNDLTIPYNPSFEEMQSYTFEELQAFTFGEIGEGTLSGTYTTEVKDVGYVASFKILTDIVVSIVTGLAWSDDGTLRFNSSETTRFSGEETGDNHSLEIRTSEDNITWTDWRAYQIGEYNCRYYQLRLTLSRDNTGVDVVCTTFDHFADLPDVDEFGDDSVTVAADGKEITFDKTFHEEPSVHIEVTSGSGIYAKFTSKDTTGFTVKLYDAAGVAQTGDLDYHAHGI